MIRRRLSLSGAYIVLGTFLLSGCTTVDLSQISLEKTKTESLTQPAYNVVEKSSMKMTSLFVRKGWCKYSSVNPTQTAASVLLNGKNSEGDSEPVLHIVEAEQLLEAIRLADLHVNQTTKAAEVYLTTADELSELDKELSLLETALLVAKEAEGNFEEVVKLSDNQINQAELLILQQSIDKLKKVTDAYGDRMRGQISQRTNPNRS